jgi:hypothetical protein
MKKRVHLYNTIINTSFSDKKDSIVLPTNAKKIVSICPNITRGAGYISVINEKTNEQLLTQTYISDDNQHWNEKNVPVLNFPEANNLFFVFRMIDKERSRRGVCRLKIYITYLED